MDASKIDPALKIKIVKEEPDAEYGWAIHEQETDCGSFASDFGKAGSIAACLARAIPICEKENQERSEQFPAFGPDRAEYVNVSLHFCGKEAWGTMVLRRNGRTDRQWAEEIAAEMVSRLQ